MPSFSRNIAGPLIHLCNNFLSLAGVVLVTTATVIMLLLLPMTLRGEVSHPYIGILIFIAIPSVFAAGLILIPLGMWVRNRKERKTGAQSNFPPINWQNSDFRRIVMFVAVTTFLNLVISSQAAYSAVNFMDSNAFCGRTCHTVMQPEFISHENSAHARVDCAACHIGSGASWFVRSKLAGSAQLFNVTFHTYPTPIPTPVDSLRPARETCEQCHWPQRFAGDQPVAHVNFAEDEQNSSTTTVLFMKVGGHAWNGTTGIHGAHLDDKTTIEYVSTDAKRQEIPQVIYKDASGKTTIYNASGANVSADAMAKGQRRTMDCMDCHNRPTHVFKMPGRALDEAMTSGNISPSLPFIKKQGLEALTQNYPDRATAARKISDTLGAFYRDKYPQVYAQNKKDIDSAIAAVQAIYARNVFPDMKITWGTYLNNLGHTDSTGCFRCHDGNHTSASGKTIPNDCDTCHELKAVEEKNPAILTQLGIVPAQAPSPSNN